MWDMTAFVTICCNVGNDSCCHYLLQCVQWSLFVTMWAMAVVVTVCCNVDNGSCCHCLLQCVFLQHKHRKRQQKNTVTLTIKDCNLCVMPSFQVQHCKRALKQHMMLYVH